MRVTSVPEYDDRRWGGFPVLLLVALAAVLAWLFANPFFGFMVIIVVGLAVLACAEYVWQHYRPHG